MKTKRRTALKKIFASLAGLIGLGYMAKANNAVEKEALNVINSQNVPMFSSVTKYGNLIFLSGKGAHVAPFTIKNHTEIALKELEEELIKAGSSMEKVLKVNVYLDKMEDFQGMNEVYRGRFGKKPPARTTVAVARGGVPVGDALVEIDCIAYI
jgi:enamine deaminase RidA (YjgF/YER057c/UK114 family)